MAILPGIFTPRTTSDSNNQVSTGRELLNSLRDSNRQAVLDMIDGLNVGDTLLAKVVSQSGKNLQILTQEGLTLTAKNDASIQMEQGSTILFEVKKHIGRDISISPLYQNTSVQKTAETALNQAGIPITNRSLELVGRNMEYGNPIDRVALAESYKDAALFPDASIKTIVDLQKMGIEVNEKTISQYNSFSNMENSISEGFDTIADSIIEGLKGEFTFIPENNSPVSSVNEFVGTVYENMIEEQNVPLPSEPMTDTMLKIVDSLEKSEYENGVKFSAEEFDALVNDARESGLLLDNLVNASSLKVSEDGFSPLSVLKELIDDINNPVQYLEENIITEEGEEPVAPAFDAAASLNDFLSKDSVSNLLKKTLASQWSLDKNKLGDKNEMRDLYARLFSQTRDILDILNQNIAKSSQISENVSNLRSNLDFMQTLNGYVPYLQIPFHSDNSGNNSELYVYTNKKNLATRDSEVSAFIHLDMEHLGPTDVYVKLSGEHVSTNFTVKDNDTLLLIENHLDLLDRRLNDKGYSFESNVQTGVNIKSPMDQILSDTQRHLVLQETSFDARV